MIFDQKPSDRIKNASIILNRSDCSASSNSLFLLAKAACGAAVLSPHADRHNTGTIAVYEHRGFAVAGPVQTDIGGGFVTDDCVMEYRLP